MISNRDPAFLPGLMLVIAVHGAILYFLFKQQFIPSPAAGDFDGQFHSRTQAEG